MRTFLRRYWVILPMVASMATQCNQAPRPGLPTLVARVDLVLNSVPASPPVDIDAFNACLDGEDPSGMDGLENHVRANWRSTTSEPSGVPVLFTETSANVWTAIFFDVPVDFVNTMTVHDTNECARNPAGQGHVTTGVTVNGTEITAVVGQGALAFELNEDGTVKP